MSGSRDAHTVLLDPTWDRALPAGSDVHILGSGVIAITGNNAVQRALAHPDLVADHPLKASARGFGPNVLDCDGPRHRAFRALLAPVLAAGRIAEYRRALMPTLVDDLVGNLLGTTTDDFHDVYAHRLPYGIVAGVLGVDPALRDRFHELTRPLSLLLDYPTVETELTRHNIALLLDLIDIERGHHRLPPESLLATIERTRERKGLDLTDGEIRSTALLFFLAGTETSSAFITALIYCLGREGVELSALRNPAVRADLIEEVLRLYPPVRTIVRFARTDLSVAERAIPRHSAVVISIAAANRDPRLFSEPDQFRPGRPERGSIPFSVGSHGCPGAALAKSEFDLLLDRLSQRCRRVDLKRDSGRLESQSFARPADFCVEFVPPV
ncbi:cytochrome P450 [Frankia sp. AgKG'84/4]|uniref:cytochrome P450 n=1 Tax=Frankia sp. AgKG'84/4 TaxID=573490 RepID=UPI00200CE383|nr:cytochrome P450 [Frankia sp. AgKG'84/4]MCL9793443.1 cytochrome P450 [Frankia sp. AgKG'84/4]